MKVHQERPDLVRAKGRARQDEEDLPLYARPYDRGVDERPVTPVS